MNNIPIFAAPKGCPDVSQCASNQEEFITNDGCCDHVTCQCMIIIHTF